MTMQMNCLKKVSTHGHPVEKCDYKLEISQRRQLSCFVQFFSVSFSNFIHAWTYECNTRDFKNIHGLRVAESLKSMRGLRVAESLKSMRGLRVVGSAVIPRAVNARVIVPHGNQNVDFYTQIFVYFSHACFCKFF